MVRAEMVSIGRYVSATILCAGLLTGCGLFEDDLLRGTAGDGGQGDFRSDRYSPATRSVVECREGREQAGRRIGCTVGDGHDSQSHGHHELCPIAEPPAESRRNVTEVEAGDGETFRVFATVEGETFRVFATVEGETRVAGWREPPSLHLECVRGADWMSER